MARILDLHTERASRDCSGDVTISNTGPCISLLANNFMFVKTFFSIKVYLSKDLEFYFL